ncbi:ornithine cyclodeaminase family protein [Thalassospira sp. TSL5-1]|uniref:ornithine cyclodeaminase family protein n=1 Tax=Thalassospira sp. TSL5-1 TaxID=1544451 RepID=UPI00093C9E71|nr:ornithine cyclodeaminase family protein [Thalassospira sp. TSL5-1]OKH86835.1 ornithine cyclodeaminase [Thalassospira sp. TSL5-1]
MKTLLLKKSEVDQLIKMPDVIDAVEDAYKAFSSKQVVQPGYIGIKLPDHRGEIDFKLGYSRTSEIISMKAHSGGFTDNPEQHGVPNSMGTVLLFDAKSGTLICVMDGSLITGLRTGAAGAVSAKALARKNSRTISCVGTGNQARMQIRALTEVMKIDAIHAWSRTSDKRLLFKTEIEQEFGIPVIIATSKKEAVEQADILVTTTRGEGDVVEASWVKPGTHIVAIGADAPGKQEFDPEIFGIAKVVVDSVSQCCEKGETSHAVKNNIITRDGIHAEIGEILLGHKSGRESEDEITLFDSTGMAIQDNTTANRIYQNAINRNIGSFFTFFE